MLLTIFIFPLLAAIGVFALGEKLAKFIALFASVILLDLLVCYFSMAYLPEILEK